jgi:hypothetical protein
MQCITINVFGNVQKVNANADGTCPSNAYILLNNADYSLMVQSYNITPEQVLSVFSWGFGVVLFFWSLGYAVGVAKQMINKL